MLAQFNPRRLYDVYKVGVQIRTRLCGGHPRNKELIKGWVEATTGFKDEKSEVLTQAEADLVVNEVAEKSWIGFPEDAERGIFIPCRNLKAMLKQSASVLRYTVKKRGSKQILAEGMEVKALDGGERVYFGKLKADGTDESPIHVMTAQGPRTALRRMDYVERPYLEFEIWVLATAPGEDRHMGEEEITNILAHAQENGSGAARSQGEGKFDVLLFEKVNTGQMIKGSDKPEKETKPKKEKVA